MNIPKWRNQVKDRLHSLLHGAAVQLPNHAYGLISFAALAPFVSAVAAGDPSLFWASVGPIVGGVGGNLLAEQIQRWVDAANEAGIVPNALPGPGSEADPEWEIDGIFTPQLADQLMERVAADDQLLETLDELHAQLNTLELVQQSANQEILTTFTQTLRTELAQLGNAERYAESLIKIESSGPVALSGGVAAHSMPSPINITGPNAQVTIHQTNPNDPRKHNAEDDPETNEPLATNLQQPAASNHKLFTPYLQTLRLECDALPLAAVGGEMGAGQEPCLEDVYIQLDTTRRRKLTEQEKADAKKKGQLVRGNTEIPVKAQEAAEQHPNLLLLGDPGSGKSTFVRQLTGQHATRLLKGQAGHLPIFVVLHELIPALDDLSQDPAFQKGRQREQESQLLNLLTDEWRRWLDGKRLGDLAPQLVALAQTQVDPTKAAQSKPAPTKEETSILLVLDGLDEVPERLRPLLYQTIPAIQRHYPAIAQIIVTCRIRSAFQGMLPGFESFTLAPFTQEQMAEFVKAWYRTQQRLGRMDQRRADLNIQDLQRVVAGNLRELAQNPMLLTTMTIIHQKETKLPDKRVELYSLAVDLLMNRWQQNKDQVTALSPELDELLADGRRLRRILERLAYEAHTAQAADRQVGELENKARTRSPRNQERQNRQQSLGRGTLLVLLENLLEGDTLLANEFLEYIDHRAGLLVGRGGTQANSGIISGAVKPQTYSFPHRTFQEYLAGCYMNRGRGYIRTYQTHVKEGHYWRVAALMGAEELFYNNQREMDVLDLAYALCPKETPRSEAAWRSVVWSGQMASLVDQATIEGDDKTDGGKAFLKRLRNRLVKLPQTQYLTPIERAEAGTALGQLGDPRPGVDLKKGLPDIDWVPIEAGPFIMGTDPEKDHRGLSRERPQFSCTHITKPYQISRYPITVAQYGAFIRAGGYQEPSFWTEAGWQWRQMEELEGPQSNMSVFQTPNHPQIGVSWYEAMAFCRWLSQELDRPITLPSEAHWERAARHTDGRIYPWGDEFDPMNCNMVDTGIGRTTAVGLFPSGNAESGIMDMAGNVFEWTSSLYKPYPYDPEDGREDPEDGGTRMCRGGSFDHFDFDVRCATRSLNFSPTVRVEWLGFRVLSPL
ncbi:MAG: SUMF1/EgtB/PvdO family nonheme iron enzyme [Chloroflexota bacterium]